MTLDEMYLEIEQTSKYGTPLLTTDAVEILARIRSMEAKLKAAEELADLCEATSYFEGVTKAYRNAGKASA